MTFICSVLLLVVVMSSASVSAQPAPGQVKEFISDYKASAHQLNSIAQVSSFYELRQHRAAWVHNSAGTSQLIKLLLHADGFGLDTLQYHLPSLKKFTERAQLTHYDSLLFEVQMTDAALHFFNDIAYGDQPPSVSYDGLNYTPSCYNIPLGLSNAIDNGTVNALPGIVQPSSPEYISVKGMMNGLQEMVAAASFKDEIVTSTSVSVSNKQLLQRLWQLGLLDSVSFNIATSVLRVRIKQVQQLFNLLPDGIIKQPLLRELNVPLRMRIAELKLALNTVRWLSCAKATGPMIVVNIPSANLLVYEHNSVILESRIVVGKRTTRTPTLTSRVTEVILYPYWMVPNSIATKELLPLIKKNPGYLNMNAMQVLNRQGRIVSPYSINWNSLSTSYFPYVLRQSTGCDNSLGLVKLNFYNPYNVYLHDTPWKVLFASNKRYFSHGCMRVERAMDLAHLLLKGNTIAVDTLEQKGCLLNQSPIPVPATTPAPVFVLYNTAWVDSTGAVSFSEDVYGRLTYVRKPK